MPCAIVIGAAPVIAYTGAEKLAIDQDEMAVAGALAGSAIRTAKAVTVDLEIPADAEIVIEGLIDTDMLEPEGPFGESNGYVALEDFNMSMEVTAITHRRAPVFVSIISQVSPSESSVIKKLAMEPLFLSHLRDHLSLKSVRRVVMHEPLSNLRPILFVQFANGTPKTEVWRGLQGAAARQADCGKIVIAVSEDIDPDNTDAVMWSLAYRLNPIEDVHVEPYRSPGHAPKSGPGGMESTLLIDATLKYPMAPLALPGREFMERAQALWQELGLPKLAVRPPWHGYSLGIGPRHGRQPRAMRRWRLGQERRGDLDPAAGRPDTGDAGADGRSRSATRGMMRAPCRPHRPAAPPEQMLSTPSRRVLSSPLRMWLL